MIDMSYKQYKLDNGLTVALKHLDCGTVTGVLRVWQGALDEKPGEDGLVHFLEHIIGFGGSKEKNSKATLRQLGIFGEYNAFTMLDRTVYNVGVLPRHLNQAIEYFSNSAFNPAFDQERFEIEKKAILREISNSTNRKPRMDTFDKLYYGEKNLEKIRGWFTAVQGDAIKDTTLDKLKEIHKRGYVPNNSDLIIVGELPANIEDIIQDNFAKYEQGECNRIRIPNMDIKDIRTKSVSSPRQSSEDNSQNSSASFTLAIPMAQYHEDDYFSALAISQVLGSGISSRLMQNLRHTNGLTYRVLAEYITRPHTTRMDIYGDIPATQQNEALDNIFEELNRLKNEPVSQEEIQKMFLSREYKLTKASNSPETIINHIAANIEHNTVNEYDTKRWQEVTQESIMAAAKKYLPSNRQEGIYALYIEDPVIKDL